MKVDQQKKHRSALLDKSMTVEEVEREERVRLTTSLHIMSIFLSKNCFDVQKLDRYIEEETNKIDMKTIIELDQVVSHSINFLFIFLPALPFPQPLP